MHRFDTPIPPQLNILFRSGDITIDTTDTTETVVELTGYSDDDATRELVAATKIEQRRGEIVVHTPKTTDFLRRTPALRLSITAPHDSELEIKSDNGDVKVSGTVGASRIDTGSGAVSVQRCGGKARIRSGSGEVRVDSALEALEVQTGSGDIEVGNADSSLAAQSGSGDLEIRYAAGAAKLQTGSGDIELHDSEHDVAAQTGSGNVTVSRVRRGRVKIEAATGDIRLGVRNGTAAWLDIHTLTGRVSSDLEATEPPTNSDEQVRVQVNTVSGDISLVRA